MTWTSVVGFDWSGVLAAQCHAWLNAPELWGYQLVLLLTRQWWSLKLNRINPGQISSHINDFYFTTVIVTCWTICRAHFYGYRIPVCLLQRGWWWEARREWCKFICVLLQCSSGERSCSGTGGWLCPGLEVLYHTCDRLLLKCDMGWSWLKSQNLLNYSLLIWWLVICTTFFCSTSSL